MHLIQRYPSEKKTSFFNPTPCQVVGSLDGIQDRGLDNLLSARKCTKMIATLAISVV
jgi:hypothetical protein